MATEPTTIDQQLATALPYMPVAMFAALTAMWRARAARWWNIAAHGLIAIPIVVLAGMASLDLLPQYPRLSFPIAYVCGAFSKKMFEIGIDWLVVKAGLPVPKRRKSD